MDLFDNSVSCHGLKSDKSRKILGKLALNVLDWRRFDSPNKQTAGLQGWQTVVGVRRGSEPKAADLAEQKPEGANSARSANRLLSDVGAYLIIKL